MEVSATRLHAMWVALFSRVVFLMLNLDIWLVLAKILNRNFLFLKYFPKSVYRLMFVLDSPLGNEQTFLKKFYESIQRFMG